MSDVIFLATILGFFALCVAYIKLCDRIIGSDAEVDFALSDDEHDAALDAAA